MRSLAALLVVLAASPAVAVPRQPTLTRYEARTLVTGTDMRSRPTGLATCFVDVLVKVSGDPTLADDPRVPQFAAHATDDVADYDYRDRMSGLAHHDEQGSSDRPFILAVRFVPERIDAVLHTLGRGPWPDPRPHLLPEIHVRTANAAFDITETEPRADGMRAAWADSGERYGIAIDIPPTTAPATTVAATLAGTLVFSEAAHGWVGSWHLAWQGRDYAWGLSGVGFDEAFRQATRGAMQVLSGHGMPQSAP